MKMKNIQIIIKKICPIILAHWSKAKNLILNFINLWRFLGGWLQDNLFKFKTLLAKTPSYIWIVIGIVLLTVAPVLLKNLTGFDLYAHSKGYDSLIYGELNEAFVDAGNNRARFCAEIRRALGISNCYLILWLFFSIFEAIKLKFKLKSKVQLMEYLPNKALMGAAMVVVIGGFEGLGELDQIDHHHNDNPVTRGLKSSLTDTAIEAESNSLSLSATQTALQRQRENEAKVPELNPEGKAEPVNIKKDISSSSRYADFNYMFQLGNPAPWVISPTSPLDSKIFPSGSGENTFLQGGEFEKYKHNFAMEFKSSKSEPSADLINQGTGQISNPVSNRESQSKIIELLQKKLK